MKKNEVSIQFTVLTLFPELIQSYLSDALLSKAIQQKRIQVEVVPLRQFSEGRYKSIDDVPYGGGDGMVFQASVLEAALLSLDNIIKRRRKIVYLSPQGKVWNSKFARETVKEWSFDEKNIREVVLICGRYGGIDQRFIQKYVDEEISIGDYVLSGGELAALVLIESASRFVPGVLGHSQSAVHDSFENNWLEAPQFTKPQIWSDLKVPETLTSGNHKKIEHWKSWVAKLVTYKKRPDLFSIHATDKDKAELKDFYKTLSPEDLRTLQLENLEFKK